MIEQTQPRVSLKTGFDPGLSGVNQFQYALNVKVAQMRHQGDHLPIEDLLEDPNNAVDAGPSEGMS